MKRKKLTRHEEEMGEIPYEFNRLEHAIMVIIVVVSLAGIIYLGGG